jgi:hypothetical protein
MRTGRFGRAIVSPDTVMAGDDAFGTEPAPPNRRPAARLNSLYWPISIDLIVCEITI